jgi:hypothetical protein
MLSKKFKRSLHILEDDASSVQVDIFFKFIIKIVPLQNIQGHGIYIQN